MKGIIIRDHEITNQIRLWGQPRYEFWKFIAAKSILFYVLAALGFALAGQLVFFHFALSFVITYLVASLLQRLIRRQRPDFEHLTGYKMWVHTYSHPSAHAALSAVASLSLVLMTQFSSIEVGIVVAVGSFALMFMIGISRVVVGVHYFTDVVFGWLLGFVVTLAYIILL